MSPDGKVISIISKNKIKMIEVNTLRDVARVNLNEFIKVDRAILITSVNFIDDYNFAMVTVQGHLIVMHYPSGMVHYSNIPEVRLLLVLKARKLRISLLSWFSTDCS